MAEHVRESTALLRCLENVTGFGEVGRVIL